MPVPRTLIASLTAVPYGPSSAGAAADEAIASPVHSRLWPRRIARRGAFGAFAAD